MGEVWTGRKKYRLENLYGGSMKHSGGLLFYFPCSKTRQFKYP